MKSRKTAIIVLGAPRSGTSAVSHALSVLGVNFGDESRFVDPSVATHNPIFFELESLNKLNDRIFESFGRTYADFDFMPLPDDFTVGRIDKFVPECRKFLKREFNGLALVGLKDPRFCFTLPLWVPALQQLGYEVRCVRVLRPPEEVVASNARINGDWPWTRNIRIAALSMLAAAYVTDGMDCLHVEYANALSDGPGWVARVVDWLHFGRDRDAMDAAAAVFKVELRHATDDLRPVPELLTTLYEEAMSGRVVPKRYLDFARTLRALGVERLGDAGTIADRGLSVDRSDTGYTVPHLTDAHGQDGASGAAWAELHYRSDDQDFSPERMCRSENAWTSSDDAIFQFTLPAHVRVTSIRFDPACEAGAFRLDRLLIDGVGVDDLPARVGSANQARIDRDLGAGVWFVSNDDDPWIELNVGELVPNVASPVSIKVRCHRRKVDFEVLGALLISERRGDRARVDALQTEQDRQAAELAEYHERERALQAERDRQAAELAEYREHERALQAERDRQAVELAEHLERERALQAERDRQAAELAERLERERALQAERDRQAAELADDRERERKARQVLFSVSARVVDVQQQHALMSAQHVALQKRDAALQERDAAFQKRDAALREHLEGQRVVEARLRGERVALQQELAAVHASTLWRASLVLRRLARAAWRAATPWRIPARRRFLQQHSPLPSSGTVDDPDTTSTLVPASLEVSGLPEVPELPRQSDDLTLGGLIPVAPPGGYTYVPPAPDPGAVKAALLGLSKPPTFSVVVPIYNTDPDLLRCTIASVEAQWYPNWELILVDDHSPAPHVRQILDALTGPRITVVHLDENRRISGATNVGLARATGDYIVFLDHDDELTPDCLYELALCIDRDDPDYIYSDEDKLDVDGSFRDPFFKPDWSPDTMMSVMLTCHVSCVRRTLANEVGGLRGEYDGSQDWDFVLRVTERAKRIVHIPKVLYHWRIIPASCASDLQAKPYAIEASKRAREDALQRRGLSGELVPVPGLPGYFRTRYHLQGDPLFSIIIPSKNNGKVLKTCIDSIFDKTRYRRFEVIVVNNGSTDTATLADLADLASHAGVTVLDHDVPFNYSEINNFGVKHARGEILVFLNDDTEVISEDWLEYMGGYAQLPHVGAVGAKLLYPGAALVQHVGVLNLAPGPAHAFARLPAHAPGHFVRNMLEYNWIAVTGACLMLERAKFDACGGFDEDLAVAYNDIALCFSLLEDGLYNMVCPGIELIHHESLSRGNDLIDPAKLQRLDRERAIVTRKHPQFVGRDPFYNPNLDPNDPNFKIRVGSRAFAECVPVDREVRKDPADGQCALDIVNGERPGSVVVVTRGSIVTFAGWAGDGHGHAAGVIEMVLTRGEQSYSATTVTGTPRPDVAKALNREGLAKSGYLLTTSLENVESGTYGLYLVKRCDSGVACELVPRLVVQ